MANPERYPFVSSDTALGEASFRPYLPFTLKVFLRQLMFYKQLKVISWKQHH